MSTLHWDFFGPSAQRTAEHFKAHLDEFLIREGVEDCETGTASAQAGHFGAWCRTPPQHEELLVASLKPKRKT